MHQISNVPLLEFEHHYNLGTSYPCFCQCKNCGCYKVMGLKIGNARMSEEPLKIVVERLACQEYSQTLDQAPMVSMPDISGATWQGNTCRQSGGWAPVWVYHHQSVCTVKKRSVWPKAHPPNWLKSPGPDPEHYPYCSKWPAHPLWSKQNRPESTWQRWMSSTKAEWWDGVYRRTAISYEEQSWVW